MYNIFDVEPEPIVIKLAQECVLPTIKTSIALQCDDCRRGRVVTDHHKGITRKPDLNLYHWFETNENKKIQMNPCRAYRIRRYFNFMEPLVGMEGTDIY